MYDDDSEDILEEETEDCHACGGNEKTNDPKAWIGCEQCMRWFHKTCIDPSYKNMSLKEIENLDFKCNVCLKRSAK